MSYSNKQVPLPIAIIVLLAKSPLFLVSFLFKSKILLIVVIIALVAFFGISSIISTMKERNPAPPIPEYQQVAPTKIEAPTVVATGSRVYYVSDFTQDEEGVTLLSFYVYDKEVWEQRATPLRIDRNSYGKIKIYPR